MAKSKSCVREGLVDPPCVREGLVKLPCAREGLVDPPCAREGLVNPPCAREGLVNPPCFKGETWWIPHHVQGRPLFCDVSTMCKGGTGDMPPRA